jgi:hypothetical protein
MSARLRLAQRTIYEYRRFGRRSLPYPPWRTFPGGAGERENRCTKVVLVVKSLTPCLPVA